MPIEFRCPQCQKLLRTPDNTAGKQAKCPQCGAVVTIPAPTVAPPSAAAPGPPDGGAGVPPPRPAAAGPGPSPFAQPQPGPTETGNPYQSPGHYEYGPTAGAPLGPIQPTKIEMGDIFSRTWAIFKQQWLMALAGWGVLFFVNVAAGFVIGFAGGIVGAVLGGAPARALAFVLNVGQQVFSLWLAIGMWLFMLRLARGQQAVFADLFAGGPYLLRVVGATILFMLMLFVGFLLLIVPGVIVALMFSQFQLLIVDRNLSIMEAFSVSREITQGNKLTLWAIGIVAGVVGLLLIVITCLVGALAVIPYMMLLQPVVYLAMSGQPMMERVAPAPPPAA